jgi:hypothetical protein
VGTCELVEGAEFGLERSGLDFGDRTVDGVGVEVSFYCEEGG